jgi:hypothetical protein
VIGMMVEVVPVAAITCMAPDVGEREYSCAANALPTAIGVVVRRPWEARSAEELGRFLKPFLDRLGHSQGT